ncbi:heterokaryon incompatibility protein-domain-containing protein [Collybia nuda]|uniref:Heterokaryon incompatibility protein-domain-containing protein n=1 Tax=Collybia nuda TaxID=64659 RepID=A0A9P5Y506_9AGAR|nr:heterokaryon incompatibility protein-domain-containing protein [Collybia nuda]
MRLLDTNTIKLTYFQSNVPEYAILSHVWEIEEVTFQDIVDLNKAKKMYGYAKIANACDTARQDGLEYIWIDTCCINKDSSAELSEAINSMYAWYSNAQICYTFLHDVVSEGDPNHPHSLFAMSLWFTRGWTLQELIAPSTVIFYAKDWVDIGTKASLQDTISSVTGIDSEVIVGETLLDHIPVAVRMSWAANRNTTREEDVAYSLMGIFDINMPLIYGEGRKAFIRLQHEIIKKSTDHSIFAWTAGFVSVFNGEKYRGILARSPREFRDSGNIERIQAVNLVPNINQPIPLQNIGMRPYAITNRGLQIELLTAKKTGGEVPEILAFLNCRFSGDSEPIMITLSQPPSHFFETEIYVRSETTNLNKTSGHIGPTEFSSIYIAEDYSAPNGHISTICRSFGFIVNLAVDCPPPHIEPVDCHPLILSPDMKHPTHFAGSFSENAEAVLIFEDNSGFGRFAVVGGIQKPKKLWCTILLDAEPEHGDEWDALNAYRALPIRGGIQWTKKNRFLDRAFRNLANGWSVTVITQAHLGLSAHMHPESDIEIHLKKTTPQRNQLLAGLPELPLSRDMILIIPPAPECGFVGDIDLAQGGTFAYWRPQIQR